MQGGRCPYIVEFYGCLIRDVCGSALVLVSFPGHGSFLGMRLWWINCDLANILPFLGSLSLLNLDFKVNAPR